MRSRPPIMATSSSKGKIKSRDVSTSTEASTQTEPLLTQARLAQHTRVLEQQHQHQPQPTGRRKKDFQLTSE